MNTLKATVLLATLTGLLIFVGNLYGGTNGMMIMFVFSLGMNFFSYWFSDKIVLKMYGAKEVSPQEAPDLVRMVATLAERANMPMPKVCIMHSNVPNAFATGRNPDHGVVAVTTGIMRALNYQELEGVVAHELSHIKNRDTLISTIAASIAGLITTIASIAQWAAIFGIGRSGDDGEEGGGSMLGTIFLIVLAPIAATIIQLAISRTREFTADETGGRMCGNPLALANALRKIESYAHQAVMPQATPATASLFIINPLSAAGTMATLFSTHPATEKRIAKLEQLANNMK